MVFLFGLVSVFFLNLFQFNRFGPKDGVISERDFAHFVVDYAPINSQKKKKIIQRIKKKYDKQEATLVRRCTVCAPTAVYCLARCSYI